MSNPVLDAAGAGVGGPPQIPAMQGTFSSHCESSEHLPPIGTGVFVGVAVGVLVGVAVGVLVGVCVGVFVAAGKQAGKPSQVKPAGPPEHGPPIHGSQVAAPPRVEHVEEHAASPPALEPTFEQTPVDGLTQPQQQAPLASTTEVVAIFPTNSVTIIAPTICDNAFNIARSRYPGRTLLSTADRGAAQMVPLHP